MRFWINFSPIGQASLPLEKAISSSDDKNDSVRPETQLEGLFKNIFLSVV